MFLLVLIGFVTGRYRSILAQDKITLPLLDFLVELDNKPIENGALHSLSLLMIEGKPFFQLAITSIHKLIGLFRQCQGYACRQS